MSEIPSQCWQRVVEYIGLEYRLRAMVLRDWRFEEARAMVNKSIGGLTLLCYRYMYPGVHPGLVTLGALWGTVIQYWCNRVRRLGMKQEQRKRAVISQLKMKFHCDNLLDRKRVLNMYIYQIIKQVLCKHPKVVMSNPERVVRLIQTYTYASVKYPLPHPPRVSHSLSKRSYSRVTVSTQLR